MTHRRDHRRLSTAWGVLTCLLLSGCASEYALMKAPGVKVAPASADCSFEVSKGLPAALDFVEIGRLEAQFFPVSDLEKLRASVHDDVCSIGGDLVVGEWDGDHFMAAIVYKRRAASAVAPAHGVPAPGASAPGTSATPPLTAAPPTAAASTAAQPTAPVSTAAQPTAPVSTAAPNP